MEVMKSQIRKAPPHQFFKINLTGDSNLEEPVDLEALARMDRVVQVQSRCQPDYDLEKLKLQYQGQILGTGCGTVSMTKDTEFPKRAYELGKSL